MYVQNKSIIVVCEGPSERAYLQELNRYLDSVFQKLLRQCVRMITVWQNGRILSLHEKVPLGQVVRCVTAIIVMPDNIDKKSDEVESRLQRSTKTHEPIGSLP